MIYATDLDRTLIFSKKFIENNSEHNKIKIEPIEYKDDRIISYIATRVEKELKAIENISNLIFVVVTTRSLEEYQRILLPINPDYTICSNGGTILHKGIIQEEYYNYTNKIIKNLRINLKDTLKDVKKLECISNTPRIVDDRYIFCKTNNEEVFNKEIYKLLNKNKFTVTVQRGKCYIIPNGIDKRSSLNWLKEYLNENHILAVGDSELDIPMLEFADYAFTQKHGEIFKQGVVPSNCQVIQSGLNSPLITLDIAKKICSNF